MSRAVAYLGLVVLLLNQHASFAKDTNEQRLKGLLKDASIATLFGNKDEAFAKLQTAEWLIDQGTDVNIESPLLEVIHGATTSYARGPLYEKWVHIGQSIIDRAADFRTLSGNKSYKANAFHEAVWSGIPELVNAMLRKDRTIADVKRIRSDEAHPATWLALDQADRLGTHKPHSEVYYTILDSLEKAGAELNASVPQGLLKGVEQPKEVSSLAYFAAVGNDRAVKYLVSKNVAVSSADVEFAKAVDGYCNRVYGTDEPFSASTPSFCRRSKDRKHIVDFLEQKLKLTTGTSSRTVPSTH